ncbi:MAG: LptA/OstA family protein [Candidatus Omnitrophica bacterium]|nr:LptA/OstA family protein [Candidatus Omnitrophota bacterium]
MKKFISLTAILGFLVFFAAVSFAETEQKPEESKQTEVKASPEAKIVKGAPSLEKLPGSLEAVADKLEYSREDHKITGIGNVVVTYKNTKLTADKVEVYSDTKKAYAEGHVKIYHGEAILTGDKAYYDFQTNKGSLPGGRAIYPPWYAYGDQIEQVSADEIKVYNGWVSTCDYTRPHWAVQAQRATIYPGDKIIAQNVTLRVLGAPIAWLPFLTVPLDSDDSPIDVEPGYSKDFGFYVLTSAAVSLNKNIKVTGHVDWYQNRGVGGGVDVKYRFEHLGRGVSNTYIIQDNKKPNVNEANPFDNRSESWRYRASWKHLAPIDPQTYAFLQVNKFSDEYFMQEYFEDEYDREIHPRTSFSLTHDTDLYGFYVDVWKRLNSFYDEIEKLPEVRFHMNRQEVRSTNLYYESDSSMTNFNRLYARSPVSESVKRFDTAHELSYPLRWNQINFVPYGNVHETFYSRQVDSGNPRMRTILGSGIESNTRFFKTWDKEGDILGIKWNKIRHIVEPSVVYDGIRECTVSHQDIFEMDAIDRLDDIDIVVFGIENRLQTKRLEKGKWTRVDIVSVNTYLAYEFHSEEYGGNRFTRTNAEVILRPYDWLQFKFDTEYNIVRQQFENANLDIVVGSDRVTMLLSWRFLKRVEVGDVRYLITEGVVPDSGNKLLTFDVSYKINKLWTIGGYIRTEFYNQIIQEWELRATRDLHDWLLHFGFNCRDSDINKTNLTAFFELTLKAFPGINLKAGHRASFSSPRIGREISGSSITPITSRVGSGGLV